MKPFLYRLIIALGLGSITYSAQAAIYICQVDGKAVFTQTKQGSNCVASHMEGSKEVPLTEAASAVPVAANLKEKPGSAAPDIDDIKILPHPAASGSVTNTSEAANPKLDVKLRNGQNTLGNTGALSAKAAKAKAAELNRKLKIIPAPIIAAPVAKPKPQLTRKQILQNEVRNEKTALVRAQAQLNVARKKGDKAKVSRLEQDVRDRQANIKAIEGEMSR